MAKVTNGRRFLRLLAVIFLACHVQAGESPPAVVMARPTWDTGWFQAEVIKTLLTELGYAVIGPQTMENAEFYEAVQDGTVDFWAIGWLPLHETYFDPDPESQSRAIMIGELIPEIALQGYLVDRRTAEAHDLRWLTDLQRPEIARLFDHTGDGRADLIGCNPGWGCAEMIEQHLSRYGLHDTVNHVQGDYSPLMGNLLQRYQQGQPVLFYTWTPNWTIGALPPGDAVQWLQLPPDETPEGKLVPGFDHIEGCPDTPCHLGWPATDIRVVANAETLGLLCAASNLLASIRIPAQDIHAQNARMYAGEDTQDDIRQHAQDWIRGHRPRVDRWLDSAREYPLAPGIAGLAPRSSASPDMEADAHVVRVVARVLPPFVTYEELAYRGLSMELLEAIAADRNWELEITGVNSTARLLDDLQRGVADIAVAALALTADRERAVDLSHPYLSSGLQILARSDTRDRRGLLAATKDALAQIQRVVPVLLTFLLVTLIAAHLIWWIERHRNAEFPADYSRGVFAGLWWAVVTVTTVGYGDKTPKANLGKVIAIFWVLAGYFVFAYFTAAVSSSVTVSRMRAAIDGPEDLHRVRVGVVQNSVALDELRRRGIRPQQRPTIEQLLTDLGKDELDAVVHHAPFLQHYAHHQGAGEVAVVGSIFGEIQYGFAVPELSPLREALNRSLLDVMEDGRLDAIADRWL